MRTLVIETATAACSVALIEDGRVVDSRHEVVGRGHAERLVPMIGELDGGGRAAGVLVDCGPGSFTGIRVGIAAARGLGIGWGVAATGFSSLPLVAAAAFARMPGHDRVAVVMEGGHGEVFVQRYRRDPFAALEAFGSMKPEAAIAAIGSLTAIGDGVRHLLSIDPSLSPVEAYPIAADAILLPAGFRVLAPTPIYGREPDAKLPGGRAPSA